MRGLFGTGLLIGIFHIYMAITPTFAATETCTDR
jgi:hypothetical protein